MCESQSTGSSCISKMHTLFLYLAGPVKPGDVPTVYNIRDQPSHTVAQAMNKEVVLRPGGSGHFQPQPLFNLDWSWPRFT